MAKSKKINSIKRRKLKHWILRTYGDGSTTPCQGCGKTLTYETMTIDRHPICGWDGGGYAQNNVRPLCLQCNQDDGAARKADRIAEDHLWVWRGRPSLRRPHELLGDERRAE